MEFFIKVLSLNTLNIIAFTLVFSAELAAKVGPGPVAATQLQTEVHYTNVLMAFERHFSSANFFTLLGKHFDRM